MRGVEELDEVVHELFRVVKRTGWRGVDVEVVCILLLRRRGQSGRVFSGKALEELLHQRLCGPGVPSETGHYPGAVAMHHEADELTEHT